MEIFAARSEEEFRAGRELFLEYAESLGVDLCFQNFNRELETLATMCGPPKGCLLMARDAAHKIAGCVALREFSPPCYANPLDGVQFMALDLRNGTKERAG